MAKNIVILFDGTSNEIKADRTNILRLYGVLEKTEQQLVYYDPGVGTLGDEGSYSRFKRKLKEIWGLLTGSGLDKNVVEAYQFLVENYSKGDDHQPRDKIYIFGFSRGAYSARILAGFIHAIGLIEPRNLNLLYYAYHAYKKVNEGSVEEDFKEVRLYERILHTDRPPIRMLGLFDTVSSVIESKGIGFRLKSHEFTRHNPSVESISHAVAIDEKRTMFRPMLWPKGQKYCENPCDESQVVKQDVEEVWFAGVHGDIGGGFPEEESQLCKIPLIWMIERSKICGLHFDEETVNSLVLGKAKNSKYCAPSALAEAHNSMNIGWSILEFLPRKKPENSTRPSLFGVTIPFFEQRHIPPYSKIHRSVIERKDILGRWSDNIPTDFRACD